MKRHLLPGGVLLAIAVLLFRLPLFAGNRFIGNSDRWNHYLSFAAFHGANLSVGRLSAWSEHLFMGFDTLALPFSFVSPVFALPPLLGTTDVVRVFGYVAPAILFATLVVTYAVLHAACRDRLAALAGACVYGLSIWSLLKLTQNDNSYLSVFVFPVLFGLVWTISPHNWVRRLVAMTIVIWICLYWSFLNYFAYVIAFLLVYGVYRWRRGDRAPGVVVTCALAIATLLAVPRLIALLNGLRGSTRTAGSPIMDYVSPVLFLRYLDGDIFGRSWREALPGHSLNLSEGNLLFASIFASLLFLWIALGRSYRATISENGQRREVQFGFFVGFVAAVFLVIHVMPFYKIFSLLFLNVSFLHTRFALAALLPIALVTTLYLADVGPAQGRRGLAAIAVLSTAALAISFIDFDWLTQTALRRLGQPSRMFVPVPGRVAAVVLPEVVKLFALATAFAGLLAAHGLGWIGGATLRRTLAIVIVGQAVAHADHFISGPHTRTYAVPFEKFDSIMAGHDEFVPPTAEQRATLAKRLDNDRYRSILVCPHDVIPVDCSTGLALPWGLRLVDGYLSAVPPRYGALPWHPPVIGVRSVRFFGLGADTPGGPPPWRLLSLLNARNVILVSKELLLNRDLDVNRNPVILENPSSYVYPRAYFADHTRAVSEMEAANAVTENFGPCRRAAGPCSDALTAKYPVDYVEGPILGDFDATGVITWRFEGDRAVFQFPASPKKRFLVINERYEPGWMAYAAGRTLDVYPTNVVMLGVVVPEGAAELVLRYRSVVEATTAYLAVIGPAAFVVCLLLRRRLGKWINTPLDHVRASR